MPRYKLRTLLLMLAILPPLLWVGWGKYEAWRAVRQAEIARREDVRRVLVAQLAARAAAPVNAQAFVAAMIAERAEQELHRAQIEAKIQELVEAKFQERTEQIRERLQQSNDTARLESLIRSGYLPHIRRQVPTERGNQMPDVSEMYNLFKEIREEVRRELSDLERGKGQ